MPFPHDPFHLHLSLPDETATARLATALAARLRPGDTVLLQGDVGAGKSALARAIIRARLGAATEVPSPTYTLVQTYGSGRDEIWHADLYRLGGPDDIAEIGLLDALDTAICLIEWPDRLGDGAPAGALTVALSVRGETARRARLSGAAGWRDRLNGLTVDA
jgi:tRNA threonylcarbamoyladenosine biosynthesis protein TsaE